jgi:hypothetical protein
LGANSETGLMAGFVYLNCFSIPPEVMRIEHGRYQPDYGDLLVIDSHYKFLRISQEINTFSSMDNVAYTFLIKMPVTWKAFIIPDCMEQYRLSSI